MSEPLSAPREIVLVDCQDEVHCVTAELDDGPIIAQDVPVDHTCTPERVAQAGHDVEKRVRARAVRLVLEERVFVHGRRTVVFG